MSDTLGANLRLLCSHYRSIAEVCRKLAINRAQFNKYLAGQSRPTPYNLKRICEDHLAGRYRIDVVDLLVTPQLAAGDQIVAVPTLVRHLPPPLKRIIGNLSDTEKVIVGLDLRPRRPGS